MPILTSKPLGSESPTTLTLSGEWRHLKRGWKWFMVAAQHRTGRRETTLMSPRPDTTDLLREAGVATGVYEPPQVRVLGNVRDLLAQVKSGPVDCLGGMRGLDTPGSCEFP